MERFYNDTYDLRNASYETSEDNQYYTPFELKIAILVCVTFGITIIVGIVGNSLVLLTILLQKQMRSTTNILILNLAFAELLFILLCVPFTGLNYVLSVWHFGDYVCRFYQYTSNVTCYVIVFLLVFMSLDRYLAINNLAGCRTRNKKNAFRTVYLLWAFVLLTNLPHLFLWEEYSYSIEFKKRTVCILKYNIIISNETANKTDLETAEFKIRAYYSIFFVFGYLIPLLSIGIIYGLIMLKLKKAKGQAVSKNKRRVTFMVIAVVSSFVLCWGPLQIMLFMQHVLKFELNEIGIIILVTSNCVAYLNTCINPIIYGFANQDFRLAYAAILRCQYHHKQYVAVGLAHHNDTNRLNDDKSSAKPKPKTNIELKKIQNI